MAKQTQGPRLLVFLFTLGLAFILWSTVLWSAVVQIASNLQPNFRTVALLPWVTSNKLLVSLILAFVVALLMTVLAGRRSSHSRAAQVQVEGQQPHA